MSNSQTVSLIHIYFDFLASARVEIERFSLKTFNTLRSISGVDLDG